MFDLILRFIAVVLAIFFAFCIVAAGIIVWAQFKWTDCYPEYDEIIHRTREHD